MAVSSLTKVGIGKETNWGETVVPAVLLPVAPPSFTEPYEQILDQNLRGIAAKDFAAYQGVGHVEASLTGPFYPLECGYYLLGVMGAEVKSGDAAPYTHAFSLGTTPASFSIEDAHFVTGGPEAYRYLGMMVSELGFTFNAAEGVVECSASLTGKSRSDIVTSVIPADAALAPMRGWMMHSTIGGAAACVIEGELTLAREIALVYCGSVGSGGSQAPVKAYAGPLEVTGRMTLDFTADTLVDRYTAKTQEAVVLDFVYGADAALKQLTFTATKVDFGEGPVEIDRSGVYVRLAYSMRMLYNATDVGPIAVSLKNAKDLAY